MGRRKLQDPYLRGPTWIPHRQRWRVKAIRPGAQRREIERWFDSEESAQSAMAGGVAQFVETLKVGRKFCRARRKQERVYFIQAGEDGPIKIGRAFDVVRRMNGLQAANWMPLRLLAAMDTIDERETHRRFAHLRIRGEWFRSAPEIIAFISGAVSGSCR